jgi:hypothetical protein
LIKCKGDLIVLFSDLKGVVHHEIVPRGQTVSGQLGGHEAFAGGSAKEEA